VDLNLEPRRVTRALIWIIAVLTAAHAVGQVLILTCGYDHEFAFVRSKFDLDGEKNIPALYSSVTLLACAVLLAIITRVKKARREPFVFQWGFLAVVFLALAIDESIAFHESLHEPMVSLLNLSGWLYAGWVVPVGGLMIVVLLVCLKFLIALPVRTRRLFIAAGVIYVTGAMLMEMAGASYLDAIGGTAASKDDRGIVWSLFVTAEEVLEMAGVAVFIHALMSYISNELGGLCIRIPPG
jgi:hypothetical protein